MAQQVPAPPPIRMARVPQGMASHVQAAVVRVAQASTQGQVSPSRVAAPHVQVAVARAAQARVQGPVSPARSTAPHVQAAIARGGPVRMQGTMPSPQAPSALVQRGAAGVTQAERERRPGTAANARLRTADCILPMRVGNYRRLFSQVNSHLVKKISTFIPGSVKYDSKRDIVLENAARKYADENNLTFISPEHFWQLKNQKELKNEELFVVGEQADLNKMVKKVDGKLVPGVIDFVRKLEKYGLDVSKVPQITILSCHSAEAIEALSEAYSGKQVTGVKGVVKLEKDGEIYLGSKDSESEIFVHKPAKEKIKTVYEGKSVETPSDHGIFKVVTDPFGLFAGMWNTVSSLWSKKN